MAIRVRQIPPAPTCRQRLAYRHGLRLHWLWLAVPELSCLPVELPMAHHHRRRRSYHEHARRDANHPRRLECLDKLLYLDANLPSPSGYFAGAANAIRPASRTDRRSISSGPVTASLPALYMRHNLADDTSHTGSLSDSPDIILKNKPVANPQATYSTPASVASDMERDPDVITGQDNYVYLRVWNRGAGDASNVFASLY